MSEVPIPERSLQRLRVQYGQFEELAAVVAEAVGVQHGTLRSVELGRGVFVVYDGDQAETPSGPHNGVVQEAHAHD